MQAFITTPLPLSRSHRLRTSSRNRPSHQSRRPPTAALSDVLIVGANRGLGLQIASVLHSQGASRLITTFRATSSVPPTLAALSTASHELDALDRSHVSTLVSSVAPSVLISCVGGSVAEDYLPDFEANKNLIDAAIDAGVQRFVLISALGAGDSEGSVPFQVMDTMRPLLLEKSHAETYLREKSLPWTIARPGPLVDGPATGSAVATEGRQCYGTVTREDLAHVVVKAADSGKALGKTLHVVDSKKVLVTSPYVRPLEFWEPLPFEEFAL